MKNEKNEDAEMEAMLELLRPVEKASAQNDEKADSVSGEWWQEIEKAFEATPSEREKTPDDRQPATFDEIVQRARKGPHLPKLDPLPSNIIVAAQYHPGFCADLSSWNLTINDAGDLAFHLIVNKAANGWKKTYIEETKNIGAVAVERLLQRAKELKFTSFQNVTHNITSDVDSARLSFRIDGEIVTYVRDGSGELSEEHDRNFHALWREVESHAPFPNL